MKLGRNSAILPTNLPKVCESLKSFPEDLKGMSTGAELCTEVGCLLLQASSGTVLNAHSGSGCLEEEEILQICVQLFLKRALNRNGLEPHLQQTCSASREFALYFQKRSFQ